MVCPAGRMDCKKTMGGNNRIHCSVCRRVLWTSVYENQRLVGELLPRRRPRTAQNGRVQSRIRQRQLCCRNDRLRQHFYQRESGTHTRAVERDARQYVVCRQDDLYYRHRVYDRQRRGYVYRTDCARRDTFRRGRTCRDTPQGISQTVYCQPTRIARRQKYLGIAQTASLPRRFGMVQGQRLGASREPDR